MPQFDLPLDQLRAYDPALPAPPDLDAFWATTLAEARAIDLAPTFDPVENGLATIETFDVAFSGFGGHRIRGWLHLPRHRADRLAGVVEYIGYGGGRGLPHERALWAAAGYAHLVMDTRGQGSSWFVGDTPDPGAGGAPSSPGFMTAGITDPHSYFYRRVYTDAARAIETIRSHPVVDGARVAVTGGSQGGALSIAAAALVPDVVAVATDVPFLSDFPRAITLVATEPYAEVARYLKAHRDHLDLALRTLSYIDTAVLGRRAVAPALFSVGLMDDITPPSTVYAAYHAYGGPKRIVEYPFNGHEGGQGFHEQAKIRFLAEHLGG